MGRIRKADTTRLNTLAARGQVVQRQAVETRISILPLTRISNLSNMASAASIFMYGEIKRVIDNLDYAYYNLLNQGEEYRRYGSTGTIKYIRISVTYTDKVNGQLAAIGKVLHRYMGDFPRRDYDRARVTLQRLDDVHRKLGKEIYHAFRELQKQGLR